MAEETAENKAARQAGWELPKWTLCYVQPIIIIKKKIHILTAWSVELSTTHYHSHRLVFTECDKVLCRELGIFRQQVVRGAFEGSRSKGFDPRDRSYDSFLDSRPEPLYKPTQSHTRPVWNEV
jgi:hypothetical protein